MTAKRLRPFRPDRKKPGTNILDPARPRPRPPAELAAGHYDGDGCTFPEPAHFAVTAGDR